MTRRLLISASILALTAGCSSSSSGNNGTTGDSGTSGGDSSSAADTGTAPEDGGTGDTGTAADTGTTPTGDSGTTTSEAGTCSAAASVSNPQTFTSVTQQSVCTSAQITAGVTACFGTTGSAANCAAWQAANAACAACAIPAPPADGGALPNNGTPGLLCVDALGECFVNVDGCVQIEDGNATCATADENLSLCAYDACSSATCVADLQSTLTSDQTDFNNCFDAAQMLACSSQLTAWQTACANDLADGGSESKCTAGTGNAAVENVLKVICDGNNM